MKVSVYIPTYRRVAFLKRAVADVMAQTFTDWELIVSDNEVGEENETWRYLQGLASKDGRVHVFKNPGAIHDQAHNVNNALSHCRGEWVKPFYDDDRMSSECLEKMVAVGERFPSVAMVGCRAQQWRAGVHVGDEKNFAQGEVDILKSADVRRAICLYDRWNGRTPQHMLIRRTAIEAGAWMPVDCPYSIPIDTVWFANILDHGDYAMMKDVLVCQCEGEVSSLTGDMRQREAELDKELLLAYRDVYDAMPQKSGLSWRSVRGEINGIRGVYHIKSGRGVLGLKMLLRSLLSIGGFFLTCRWLLQEMFPSRFPATPRASQRAQKSND